MSCCPWRVEMLYGALQLRWCHDLIGNCSPIDTPRDIFVFVTVFSSTATWDLMTYHKYPVTSMSRYRGSNFLRQRLVLSTVSGRPVVITDIRVKATAANLTRSNFTCFIPVKFAKYSHFLGYFPLLHLASFSQDEEPGLRDYEVPLSIACHWGIFQPWSWLPSGFFVGLSSQRGSLAGPPEASFVRLLDKLCDGESLRAIFSEVNRIHTKKQYCFRIWHDMAANSVWLITLGPVFQNWYHEVQTSALTRQAGRVPMSPSGASPSLKFFYLCSLPNQNTTNDFYYLCTMWMIPSSDSYS